MLTVPQGWAPHTLCCSKLGDIYVALALLGVGKQKIARYHGQKLLQDIEKDEDGNKIFKDGFWPLYITENNNGDICVSDPNARKVVVLNMEGRVRFRYDREAVRYNWNYNNKFSPSKIVADHVSQIIVVDKRNACLHILNQDGQFL